ncbi:MAG TPA: energy transducer TonB [Pyrinomonadaceae bacterium]
MFNNLIESSSHAKEFKRRGSFLLFTTATYLVLFAVTGVISIYAYDAHLESQSTELEVHYFVPPREVEPPERVIPNTIPSKSNPDNQPTRSIRTELIDSTTNPNNPPDRIGTVASAIPPARIDSVIGDRNVDPPGPAQGSRDGVVGGTGNTSVPIDTPPPPPAPNPTPAIDKILKISVVLNSRALSLPKPAYPEMAKRIRLQGTVSVQVLIDERGNVVSVKGSGHPLLIDAAERAARQARFSPTTISDTPVKVSGMITYNFMMQ